MVRQTTITEFYPLLVRYITAVSSGSRRGFAEKIVKNRLLSNGWAVWRGGLITGNPRYPAAAKKYSLLRKLLISHFPSFFSELCFLCDVSYGMPDFICFKSGSFLFVEAKLGYESLSLSQKKSIARLLFMGFRVEVHRVVPFCVNTRSALFYPLSGHKKVLDKQLKIANFGNGK